MVWKLYLLIMKFITPWWQVLNSHLLCFASCNIVHWRLNQNSMDNVFFFLWNQSLQMVVGLTSGWPKTLREIFDCSQKKYKLYGTSMCSQENCSLTWDEAWDWITLESLKSKWCICWLIFLDKRMVSWAGSIYIVHTHGKHSNLGLGGVQ